MLLIVLLVVYVVVMLVWMLSNLGAFGVVQVQPGQSVVLPISSWIPWIAVLILGIVVFLGGWGVITVPHEFPR